MKNKKPSFREEQLLWDKGLNFVAGVDEVGRGAFAGPLVAAAVILPKDFDQKEINDSKKLSPEKREQLSKYIILNAVCFKISEVDIDFINKFGVGQATQKAFEDCLNNLKEKFEYALIDGFKIKNLEDKFQKAIIHGDSLSVSIASASIIAKVYRDNLMRNLHLDYPVYNFFENKGYGTKVHREALKRYGLTKMHRTSFNLDKFLV